MYFMTILDTSRDLYLEAGGNYIQHCLPDDLETMEMAANLQGRAFTGLVDLFYNYPDDSDFGAAVATLFKDQTTKRVDGLNRLLSCEVLTSMTCTHLYKDDVDPIQQKNDIADFSTELFRNKMQTDHDTFVLITTRNRELHSLSPRTESIVQLGIAAGGLALGAWLLRQKPKQ